MSPASGGAVARGLSHHVNRALLTATLALAVPAAAALVWLAALNGGVAAAAVYGTSLVACAFFSFIYNVFEHSPRRPLLRRLDHSAIFLLIAGTYTPFSLSLGEGHGLVLFAVVWGLATLGIGLKLAVGARWHGLFVGAYVALGWSALFDLAGVLRGLPATALLLLAAGGGAFTLGALIHWRARGPWAEPLWHGFVLVGSAAHFAAVTAVV